MTENQFENLLNEMEEPVKVFGLMYSAGTAIKRLDPIAFRGIFLDYLDAEGLEEED